jgi:CheY-like chemotaxis protein
MHGADLAGAIRALPACERTPILGLAGEGSALDGQRCAEAGIAELVGKPVQEADLQAALNKWLPERRVRR